MDSRRWPSATRPFTQQPASSGPRCRTLTVISLMIWPRSKPFRRATIPAIPHIVRSLLEGQSNVLRQRVPTVGGRQAQPATRIVFFHSGGEDVPARIAVATVFLPIHHGQQHTA